MIVYFLSGPDEQFVFDFFYVFVVLLNRGLHVMGESDQ
jgi:hypothetical protein